MENELLQIGTLGIIFYLAIKEFFIYLKSRKENSNGKEGIINQSVLSELQKLNSNHLHSIEKSINEGNQRLIDVIHSDNIKVIELLAEIRGKIR